MHRGKNAAVIAVDIGTTSAKAILYRDGVGHEGPDAESYATSYPRPGFVEQDPSEVLAATGRAIRSIVDVNALRPGDVDAIVFDGVWQSLIVVNANGTALAPATLWADKRSMPQNERLKERFDSEEARRRTGCPLHPMYFLPRLAWIREEAPDIFRRARRFISVKEYVLEHLAGSTVADSSTASGTGVWNMERRDWDADLLGLVGLTPERFPRCVEPTSIVGGLTAVAASAVGLAEGTPVVIGASDGAMAHLGTVGLDDSLMSLTVGTGAALRRHVTSPGIIPGTEAWCYYLGAGIWLQGGVNHNAGNVMRWFADTLMPAAAPEEVFAEMNKTAASAPIGAEGLCFLPLLGGERCPHYRPEAKGVVYGLGFNHTRGHIARALMEGLAYSLYGIYRMLVKNDQPELVVTGGILKSPVWLKIVADFFGKPLWLPRMTEATAWGSVLIGLRALGVLNSLEECRSHIEFEGKIDPDKANHDEYGRLYRIYEELYQDLYGRRSVPTTKEEPN